VIAAGESGLFRTVGDLSQRGNGDPDRDPSRRMRGDQIDAALDAELRRTMGFTSNRSSNRPLQAGIARFREKPPSRLRSLPAAARLVCRSM
jgi:hypothetical protein